MKKSLFYVLVCVFAFPVIVYSQNPPVLTASDCIDYMGTGVANLSGDVDSVIGWTGRGDVSVAWNTNQRNVTFSSTGYGKGCITVKYMAKGSGSCSCPSSASIDVYKTFALPDTIGIEGPTCVSPGQTVVYSIYPIVTKNINDRIGIDGYYWNVDTMVGKSNSFVESVHYTSGDSSSVTFTVKDWDDNIGPNEISVYVGRCNIDTLIAKRTLSITKQAPKPEFGFEYLCIPYGDTPFTLNILNPSSNVEYVWAKPIDWEFVEFNSDSTSVTIRPNKTSPDTVSVSAVYKNNKGVECATSKTVLQLYRQWGSNVTIDGPQCTTIGETYRYHVTGDIPTGTKVHWEIPATWGSEGEINSPLLKAYPTALAPLSDTIKVFELSQCESVASRFVPIVVNVKPASVYLTGEQCVETDSTYTYRIQRAPNAEGPAALQYAWFINGVRQSNMSADTANITISSSTRFIQVQPLGNNGCNGSISDTLKVMVNPTNPTGIELTDPALCISSGIEDTISLRILGAVSSQDYVWDLSKTSNWQILSYPTANHSEVVIRTSGVAGSDTIEAYTLGSGLCSDTRHVTILLTTPEAETQLDKQFLPPSNVPYVYFYVPEGRTLSSTRWLVNNTPTASPIPGGIYAPGADSVSVIVTYTDGCTEKVTLHIDANSVNSNHVRKSINTSQYSSAMLKIAPNPSKDVVNIELPESSKESTIAVYSVSGKIMKVFNVDTSNVELNVGDFAEGSYVIVAQQAERVTYNHLIVKH